MSARRLKSVLALVGAGALCVGLAGCVVSKPSQPSRPPEVVATSTPSATPTTSPAENTAPELQPKTTVAPAAIHTPKAGSDERKAILDALRGPVAGDIGQPVIFKVLTIRSNGAWAYVRATPLKPNGKEIDYSKTQYREAVEAGAFDDAVDALVKNTGGTWRVSIYVIGATDVAWVPWPADYGVPQALFESP